MHQDKLEEYYCMAESVAALTLAQEAMGRVMATNYHGSGYGLVAREIRANLSKLIDANFKAIERFDKENMTFDDTNLPKPPVATPEEIERAAEEMEE
jgi:hypothetical protein